MPRFFIDLCVVSGLPCLDSFVKIDLEQRRDLHVHFEGNLDPGKLLSSLELSTNRIIAGKTLLFFDEIQACPRAITALRYFYEQLPELHVVAAGSMLEDFQVQSEILDSYRDDFSTYTPRIFKINWGRHLAPSGGKRHSYLFLGVSSRPPAQRVDFYFFFSGFLFFDIIKQSAGIKSSGLVAGSVDNPWVN